MVSSARTAIFRVGDVAEVDLVGYTTDGSKLIAMLARGYDQVFETMMGSEELEHYTNELAKTRLQTPLDAVSLTFLIRNVTRSWTHQMVRYRIGTSFVQQSLRFLESDAIPVKIPAGLTTPEKSTELAAFCQEINNT